MFVVIVKVLTKREEIFSNFPLIPGWAEESWEKAQVHGGVSCGVLWRVGWEILNEVNFFLLMFCSILDVPKGLEHQNYVNTLQFSDIFSNFWWILHQDVCRAYSTRIAGSYATTVESVIHKKFVSFFRAVTDKYQVSASRFGLMKLWRVLYD